MSGGGGGGGRGILVVFCGPYGVGKKTLMRRLKHDCPNHYSIVPVHTSAVPTARTSTAFYLVHHSRVEMSAMVGDGSVDDDEFLTHWMFDGDIYALNKHLLVSYLNSSRVCLVAVEGLEAIVRLRKSVSGLTATTFVYVSPPSTDRYVRRLRLAALHNGGGGGGKSKTETRVRDARLMEDFVNDSSELFELREVNHSIEESYLNIRRLIGERLTTCPCRQHLDNSDGSRVA